MLFLIYFLISLSLFTIPVFITTGLIISIIIYWFACSFLLVSLAYGFNMPYIFRKKVSGRMPFYIKWLFIPFLACVRFYNYCARTRDTVPPIQRIDHNLYLARRLLPSDIPALKEQGIDAVLDVTAEFSSLNLSLFHGEFEQEIRYLNIPVLDHSVPSKNQLLQALHWLDRCHKNNETVIVHCALGRGRSVFVVAAYLLCKSPGKSINDIMQKIQSIRMTSRLNKKQYKRLVKYQKNKLLQIKNSACLIVNSVAGGGKWQQHKKQITELLSPYFNITIKITSKQHNGAYLTKQALNENYDIFIACGGDGTVTEVASELTQRQQALGIIPLGTTNALSHFLWGIDAKISPIESACSHIIHGVKTRIDTAVCNNKLVLLLAGLGFEYKMIKQANREQKNNLGQLAYLQGLWSAIDLNEETPLLIKFDDEEEQAINVSSLTVANAAPFTTVLAQGGGSPDIQDGKLDVTWLPYSNKPLATTYQLVELAMSCVTNNHMGKNIVHRKISTMSIRWADKKPHEFVIDGEVFSDDTINIEVQPSSLNVLLNAE